MNTLFPMCANSLFTVLRFPRHIGNNGEPVTNFTGTPREFSIRGFIHEVTDTAEGSVPFHARGAGGSQRVFNLTCEPGTDIIKNDIVVDTTGKFLVQDVPREETNPFTGCALSLVARCVEWVG